MIDLKRIRFGVSIGLIVISIFLIIQAPSGSGTGTDADLHSAIVTGTPSTQGLGGTITVRATAEIFGGCCYNLYAYELTADLNVPDEIEIVKGPTPSRYGTIVAKPGGVATQRTFEWIITGDTAGSYDIIVVINSRNCGSVSANTTVVYMEGAAISEPKFFPDPPDKKKALFASVTASIAVPGVEIESVTIYILEGSPEFLKAENGSLLQRDGGVLVGKGLVMTPHSYQQGSWWIKAGAPSSSKICIWLVATSSEGKNTTSPVYTLKVIDREEVYSTLQILYWASTLVPIIGAIVAIHINNTILKGRIEKIMIRRTEMSRHIAMRRIAFFALITLTIIALLWTISNGMLGEVLDYLQEGNG